LLGFCEYYRQFHPDSLHHPVFNAIDDNLVYALNYFRPTAYEVNVNWFQMTRTTQKYEIPFHITAFSASNIMFVFQNYVLAKNYHHSDFVQEMRKLHPNWDIIDSLYTSSITFDGLSVVRESFGRLLTQIKENRDKKEKKAKPTTGQLGLDRF
ncbi:MAG TPA: hypothetical protein VJ044_11105, partial [Candidatus Hodarchaeales archaeon]|nr:hypothetical protein [Candidatus Hodarchaeales archaeon]